MPMIELLRPWALLLLPLPFLFWRFAPARLDAGAMSLPERLVELVRPLDAHARSRAALRRLRTLLALLGYVALVLALAGPRGESVPVPSSSGRDLMIALDLSVSMRERDVRMNDVLVSRAEAVKTLAGAFVRRREGDRVGLIAFADRPFLIAPLTYDVHAVDAFLDEVAVGLPGRKTAIGDALGLAVEQLERQPQDSRVVVLLTDGDGNAGGISPERAAELASRHQVRVHTIGFGSEVGEAKTAALAAIATATGGRHFTATSVSALQRVYEALDSLEPTTSEQQTRHAARDYARELLWLALASALLLMIGQPGWSLARFRGGDDGPAQRSHHSVPELANTDTRGDASASQSPARDVPTVAPRQVQT